MAKMGTGKLTQKQKSGKAQLFNAGFPGVLPVNLIVNPVESAPVTALGLGIYCPLGSSIMREGFTTDTGILLSSYYLDNQ